MLGPLMLAHNTAVHRATRMTPFYAMFGYDPNLPLWPDMEVLDETFRESPAKTTEEEALRAFHRRQAAARMLAGTNNTAERQRYAREPADDGPAFLKQQKVWIRTTLMPGKNQKLRPRWEKAIIIEETHPSVFKVRRFKGNKRTKTLNVERIRPRTDDLAPSEDDDADDDDSDDDQEPDDPAQAVQELIAQLTADLADDVEAWASTMEEWSLRDLQKLFTRAGRPAAQLFGLLGPQLQASASPQTAPKQEMPPSPSSDGLSDMDYEEVPSCRTVPPTAKAEAADAGRIIPPAATARSQGEADRQATGRTAARIPPPSLIRRRQRRRRRRLRVGPVRLRRHTGPVTARPARHQLPVGAQAHAQGGVRHQTLAIQRKGQAQADAHRTDAGSARPPHHDEGWAARRRKSKANASLRFKKGYNTQVTYGKT